MGPLLRTTARVPQPYGPYRCDFRTEILSGKRDGRNAQKFYCEKTKPKTNHAVCDEIPCPDVESWRNDGMVKLRRVAVVCVTNSSSAITRVARRRRPGPTDETDKFVKETHSPDLRNIVVTRRVPARRNVPVKAGWSAHQMCTHMEFRRKQLKSFIRRDDALETGTVCRAIYSYSFLRTRFINKFKLHPSK